MQSTHMASQQITEDAVYLCTGNPLPKDIEQISYWLLNEQFTDCFKSIKLICYSSWCYFVQILSLSISLYFVCITSYRNIWNQDKKRISSGGYCERSYNVSLMHHANYLSYLKLFLWSWFLYVVTTGLFLRLRCLQVLECSWWMI